MPCFTQAFTVQRRPDFSAARILPWVRASRNWRKILRASGSRPISLSAERRSMEASRDGMKWSLADGLIVDSRRALFFHRKSEIHNPDSYRHLHSLRIKTPAMVWEALRASASVA